MSKSAVCPECKTRPAPAGRYLCAECEAALVAATDGEMRRPAPRDGAKAGFSGFGLRMPRRRRRSTADTAVAIEDAGPFDRTDERPQWLQALILVALVGGGLSVAWNAKQIADGHASIGGLTVIQDMSRGLLNSWAKLKDALH